MKTSIAIEHGDVKMTFTPETDLERLALAELGDDVSVSRTHQNLVLRRRQAAVRKVSDINGGITVAK